MRHRYTHLVNSDPLVDCIVAERDGATVGYGRVEWHDLVDGDRIYDATVAIDQVVPLDPGVADRRAVAFDDEAVDTAGPS